MASLVEQDCRDIGTDYYYAQPNPYENAPSCHVNLLELSRYARQCGKALIELTSEEVSRFMIKA